jgi:hypothetical protein
MYIQKTNLEFWIPGQKVAVDKVIAKFQNNISKITIIPGKFTLIRFKIWSIV